MILLVLISSQQCNIQIFFSFLFALPMPISPSLALLLLLLWLEAHYEICRLHSLAFTQRRFLSATDTKLLTNSLLAPSTLVQPTKKGDQMNFWHILGISALSHVATVISGCQLDVTWHQMIVRGSSN